MKFHKIACLLIEEHCQGFDSISTKKKKKKNERKINGFVNYKVLTILVLLDMNFQKASF